MALKASVCVCVCVCVCVRACPGSSFDYSKEKLPFFMEVLVCGI